MDAEALERLELRLGEALQRSRRTGEPVLVSLAGECPHAADPVAVATASRRPGEPWFCLEQPDRDRWALGALGAVRTLEDSGERRFEELAESWRTLSAQALADPCDGPPGSGLLAVGGFAFAPEGGSGSPDWMGFAPASLTVPHISFSRAGTETTVTVNIEVTPDDTVEDLLAGIHARLEELREEPLPLLDPSPAMPGQIVSVMPPVHYEQAVRGALERIRRGELEKLVLAREVEVHVPAGHDAAAVLGVLREAFPSCYVLAVGRGEATLVAASPELLVRREGQRASTVALAGSARRSADPAVDGHLGEQLLRSDKDREENAIVARRIVRALAPRSVWVTAAPEPMLVKVANIQHLATPIRAQLAGPIGAIELAGMLHPTPAVGGEPPDGALAALPALEGLDRGWYAGAVGWTDASGDGEFAVALRCALLRGTVARCYAGCGIVRGSDPAAELTETEVKLEAILPLLAS